MRASNMQNIYFYSIMILDLDLMILKPSVHTILKHQDYVKYHRVLSRFVGYHYTMTLVVVKHFKEAVINNINCSMSKLCSSSVLYIYLLLIN